MRKTLVLALAAACAVLMPALFHAVALGAGGAVEVNSADLQNDWEKYDGREVVFRGEAIGDVMLRGGHAWVTVNDDFYSREARLEAEQLRGGNSGIGVWLPAEEAEKIRVLGRYGTRGDFVEVRGIFNADCAEHGGDFDIHARTLTVVEPGRELDTGPDTGKYMAAIFAMALLLGTLIPFLTRRTRNMRKARALLREEEE